MKAIEIKGELKIFSSLPKTIQLGDKLHLNIKDHNSLGFKDVITPNHDPRVEALTNLHLEGDVYTYDVEPLKIEETLAELKSEKISIIKTQVSGLLGSTDWYIIRESDTGEATPTSIKDERAALRARGNELESQINALTSKKSVVLFDINL